MTSYYFQSNEDEAREFFSGEQIELTGEFEESVAHIMEYLEETWNMPFVEFCDLATMTPVEFKEAFEDLTQKDAEELIDETVNYNIYSSQRGYVVTLAEHNRSAP